MIVSDVRCLRVGLHRPAATLPLFAESMLQALQVVFVAAIDTRYSVRTWFAVNFRYARPQPHQP